MCAQSPAMPILHEPTGCGPPGPAVHGILQARILGAISFPRGSSRPRDHTLHIVDSLRCRAETNTTS